MGNPEFDPDIQFGYLGRVSWAQPWRPLHTTQHLHMWLLIPFSTLNMLKPGEPWAVRRYRTYPGIGNPPPGWVFLVDKYLPLVLAWLPVTLGRGIGQSALSFLSFHLVVGTLVALVTQVQHNTALADDSDDYSRRWPLCEQLVRTTDVGSSAGLWWWLSGGTNFHVVHHLMPSVSFLELPHITARLRAEFAVAGLRYPVHANALAAWRSHLRLLRMLARRPASRHTPHQSDGLTHAAP